MNRIAYLLAGLLLGIAAGALVPVARADDPPACPPCPCALSPEQQAAVEALRVQVEALRK